MKILSEKNYHYQVLNKETHFSIIADFAKHHVDFFLYQDGITDETKIANSIFDDMPTDLDPKNKFVIGIFKDHQLIGIIDYLNHFPKSNISCIGLFMIDKDLRKQGLGKSLYLSFENYLKEQLVKDIYIGIISTNINALHFWKTVGYHHIGEREMKLGNLTHLVTTMKKELIEETNI